MLHSFVDLRATPEVSLLIIIRLLLLVLSYLDNLNGVKEEDAIE